MLEVLSLLGLSPPLQSNRPQLSPKCAPYSAGHYRNDPWHCHQRLLPQSKYMVYTSRTWPEGPSIAAGLTANTCLSSVLCTALPDPFSPLSAPILQLGPHVGRVDK